MPVSRALIALIGLLAFVRTVPTHAGINSWTMTGPEGGSTDSIVYHPSQAGVVLVSTPRGLYRSTDDGLNWTLVLETYPQVQQIAFDPSNANRVYAVNNQVWRSADAGVSWALAPQPLGDVTMVGVSPGGTLYVSNVSGGVRRSVDQGASWILCGRPYPQTSFNRGFTVDPNAHTSDWLYILVEGSGIAPADRGVWRSSDGCGAWTAPSAGDPGSTGGLVQLVVKPGDSSQQLLLTSSAVYATSDSGATWVATLPAGAAHAQFDPTTPNRVAAVAGQGQIFSSIDSGASWSTYGSTSTFGPHELAFSPTVAGRLLQTSSAGVFVSENAGLQFTGRRISGMRAGWVKNFSVAHDGAIFTTLTVGNDGVFRRDPVTGAWQPLENSVFSASSQGGPVQSGGVAVAPSDSNRIHALAAMNRLMTSADGGVHWTGPHATFLGLNLFVVDMQVDPNDPLTAYAATLNDGLWKTSDGGGSWTRFSVGLPTKLGPLVIAPSSSSILYVAGTLGGTGEPVQVYKTVDSGATWNAVGATPPYPNTNEYISSLSVSPHNANVVFATFLNQVHKSIDGGATWEVMNFPGVAANLITGSAVRIDPVHPGTLIVASTRFNELMRSVNNGASWEATLLARPNLPAFGMSFVLDPARPGRVVSSVWNSSVAEYEFATDLAVTMANMSGTLPVAINTPVRFTVRNQGPHAASPSDLRIDIPPNTGASWPAGCSLGMQVIYCQVPALQTNAEHVINLYLHPLNAVSGNIAANLTTHEADLVTANNSTNFAVTAGEVADIDLTLTAASATLDRGTTTEIVATLVNRGPSAATNVRLHLSGLSNFVVTSLQTDTGNCTPNGSPTCTFGTLAVDAVATVRLNLRADTAGDFAIIGAATSAAPDADGQQSSAQLPISVTRVADVAVSITESADPVVLDSPLRYTVNVENLSGDPGPAQLAVSIGGASILGALPNTGTCSSTATTVTCDFVPTPGATLTMDLGTATAGIVTATATVTYGGRDSNTANNSQTVGTTVRRTADLNVNVVPSVAASPLDTEFAFTTTVRNDGPNAAPVMLNVNLLQAQVVSASVTGGTCTNTASTADCTLASLAFATSATFTVRARGAAPGSAQAVATVTSAAFDADGSDNQATSTSVMLSRVGDIAVSITDSEDPATVGRAFNYTATVQNLGPNAGDVHLVVPVTGATVAGATPSAGTCTTTVSQVTCDMLSLSSGASASVRIDVSAASAGTAQAAPTVTFSGTDAVTTNNTATASTVVNAPPPSSNGGGSSGGGGGGGRFDWLALALLGGFAWRRLPSRVLFRR
jgi:Domain of unknown function DUF11